MTNWSFLLRGPHPHHIKQTITQSRPFIASLFSWRDRGKEAPPPPYQPEWTPVEQAPVVQVMSTPTPNLTPRALVNPDIKCHRSSLKHPVAPPENRVRPHTPTHLHHNTTHFLLLCAIPPTQPEFSSAPAEEEQEQGPLEDQMDWIGDKLAMRKQTRSTMGRGLGGKGGAPPIAFVLEFRKARGQQTLCCFFFFYHASALPRHGGFDIPPSISSSSSLILLHRRGATRVDVVRERAPREFQGRARHVG